MSIRVRPPKLALAPRGGGIKPPFFALSKIGQALRWVYNLDGVTNRAVFSNRLINPDGDIDIEWRQDIPESVNINSVIICQCGIGANTTQEFRISYLGITGALEVIVGGSVANLLTTAQGLVKKGKYRVKLVGATLSVYLNDVLVRSMAFSRGTAREPAAAFVVGARPSGSGFVNHFQGALYDMRINGTLWPMADRNQAIQLPQPSGLGAEIVTETRHTFPPIKGNHWTYLGDGRWQYVGDGNSSELRLHILAEMPAAGFLEFEVESYSGTGQMRCCAAAVGSGDRVFNSVGVKRWLYTGGTDQWAFNRNSGVVSCVIKNISFKPLWVASAAELVTNGNFNSGTAGWAVNGSLAVNSGQGVLTTTAGQNSRFEQALTVEAGAYYEISCDLVALSGVSHAVLNFRRGAISGFTTIFETSRTSAGRISFVAMATGTDVMIQVRGDATNAGTVTVDNISVRKINSLCTPLTLINTTSPGWQEIEA